MCLDSVFAFQIADLPHFNAVVGRPTVEMFPETNGTDEDQFP